MTSGVMVAVREETNHGTIITDEAGDGLPRPHAPPRLAYQGIGNLAQHSDLINESIRHALAEDQLDLSAFEERVAEPVVPFEEVLKELKKNGRI